MARHPTSSIQETPVRVTSTTCKMAPMIYNTPSEDSSSSSSSNCNSRCFVPLQRKSSLLGETSTGSASTSSSSGLEVASASRIRSRYLHKLGVGAASGVAPASSPSPLKKKQQRRTSSTKKRTGTVTGTVPLKDDLGRVDSSIASSQTTATTPLHSKYNDSSKVRFLPQVSVHSIPHKSQYSSRDKERLWMAPSELEEAAYRNCVEFASEQWDWRQATEESDFLLVQGILTHPAHALLRLQQQQQSCTPNRQFCRIFSAQQQLSTRHNQHQHHHQQTVGYR